MRPLFLKDSISFEGIGRGGVCCWKGGQDKTRKAEAGMPGTNWLLGRETHHDIS
jgi:hypothetical protein